MYKEVTLEEVSEVVAMGPFGSNMKVSSFVDQGVPIISGASLTGYKLNDKVKFNFITEEKAEKFKRSNVQRGDVVFTAYGTIGQVSYIPYDSKYEKYIVSQRQFFLRPKKNILDSEYLTNFFKTKYGQHLLLANSSQVGVPSIATPTTYLKNLKIKIPNINYQKKCSFILKMFNSKIEINQKMNETLEKIAKTLFKSWFIDFDPVRAKVEGKPTRLSKEISNLFPNSFEESELGEIPKGWSIVNLNSIAEKINDKFKKNEDWSKEKLIDLARMPSKSISLSSSGYGEELSTSVCRFKKNDFLFGSIRPYFYKAGICPFDGVTNSSVFVLRSITDNDKEFLYCYASSEKVFEKSVQFSSGTKMPIIRWKDFLDLKFVLPDKKLRNLFSDITRPYFEKIIINIYELNKLGDLRNAILPKLISGEIRISDAEKLVDEASV